MKIQIKIAWLYKPPILLIKNCLSKKNKQASFFIYSILKKATSQLILLDTI
jgi:hypothetical protein